MTRVIYTTASTLDGYLADESHSLDWLFAVPSGDADSRFAHFLEGVGAIVMGSATFEWVVAHEDLREHPEKWSQFYGTRATWVFTSRERAGIPGAPLTFVGGHVSASIDAIRESARDGDVWIVGGGDLAGQFADAGWLDEIRVSLAPATLGAGAPLLPRRLGADRLRLVEVAQIGQFAELVYAVSPPV